MPSSRVVFVRGENCVCGLIITSRRHGLYWKRLWNETRREIRKIGVGRTHEPYAGDYTPTLMQPESTYGVENNPDAHRIIWDYVFFALTSSSNTLRALDSDVRGFHIPEKNRDFWKTHDRFFAGVPSGMIARISRPDIDPGTESDQNADNTLLY